MLIRIIAIGQKMPSWVDTAYKEYEKRLVSDIRLQLIEIPAGKRSKNSNTQKLILQEGKLSLAATGKNDCIIAMDVKGKRHTTESMAQEITKLQSLGHNLSLLIGGPEGLSPDCLQAAHHQWSLSDLTLPHPMVRVILAEQIYRCWSLIQGHPYHK